MTLTMPKAIAIQNPRLNAMFKFLMLVTCGVSLGVFISNNAYNEILTAETRLSVRAAPDQSLGEAALVDQRDHPVCRETGGCVPSNTALMSTVNQERSASLFAAASVRILSTRTDSNSATPLMYVPSTQDVAVEFDYNFRLIDSQENSLITGSIAKFGSNLNAMTVVIDEDGDVWREYPPGEQIVLSIKNLVDLTSGMPASALAMDSEVPAWQRSGLEIAAQVDCFGDTFALADKLQTAAFATNVSASPSATQPVCLLSLGFLEARAESRQAILDGEQHLMQLGVRISCEKGKGVFSSVSFYKLYVYLTSAAVLAMVPRNIMLFFMVHMLGHMSTIYHQVLFQPFSIREEVAGMASRLVVQSAAFVDLAEDPDNTGVRGITRERMAERLRHVLQHRNEMLDSSEVDHLVEFCYQQCLQGGVHFDPLKEARENLSKGISKGFAKGISRTGSKQLDDKEEQQQRRWRCCSCCRRRHSQSIAGDTEAACEAGVGNTSALATTQQNATMNIDSFTIAVSNLESFDFDALVKLFDVDRKVWPLERFFMPAKIRELVHAIRHKHVPGADKKSCPEADSTANSDINITKDFVDKKEIQDTMISQFKEMHGQVHSLERRLNEQHARLTSETRTGAATDRLRSSNERAMQVRVDKELSRMSKLLSEMRTASAASSASSAADVSIEANRLEELERRVRAMEQHQPGNGSRDLLANALSSWDSGSWQPVAPPPPVLAGLEGLQLQGDDQAHTNQAVELWAKQREEAKRRRTAAARATAA